MDILAHALWAGAGVTWARRRRPISRTAVVATVGLAALPDVAHLLPLVAWWMFGDGTLAAIRAYAVAVPGSEPVLPAQVEFVSHHLHCLLHSAVVAGGITGLAWIISRRVWLPLWGWWSHIVIDVFTHSADYYAVPVLYPITMKGFDGFAWNTPAMLVGNYLLIAVAWAMLYRTRHSRQSPEVVERAPRRPSAIDRSNPG